MDRVGSRVWGDDAGVGNDSEVVDDGSKIGIGSCGMNVSVGVVAAPVFAAVFQNWMAGSTALDGANTCWKREAIVSWTIRVVAVLLQPVVSF